MSEWLGRLEARHFGITVLVLVLLGVGAGAEIDTFGGQIARAIISGEAVSSRWTGISGDVSGSRGETASPIFDFVSDNGNSGEISDFDLDAINDNNHFLVAAPEDVGSFKKSNLENVSLSELQAGGIFDQSDFPVYYPDSVSYSAVFDNPSETFTQVSSTTLLSSPYKGPRTTLRDGIEMNILGYRYEGDKIPIFVNKIKNYESCYDGSPCNFQMMMPNLQGEEYHLYQVAAVNPIEITTFIDGQESDTFEYPGVPYRLNVTTRSIFGGDSLTERDVEISERSGNNLFIPSISNEYSSEASILTSTVNGTTELMFAPTKRQAPSDYNISIRAFTEAGNIAGEEYLKVENNRQIPSFSGTSPEDKGFGELTTKFKAGTTRLVQINNCVDQNVQDNSVVDLTLTENSGNKEIVRGVPYRIQITDADVEKFLLEEFNSHLVFLPARTTKFGTPVHSSEKQIPFSADQQVIFTPTSKKSQSSNLNLDLIGSQGNKLNDVKFSVKGSTCGSVEDGSENFLSDTESFNVRVTGITQTLNSLSKAATS